MYGDASGNRLGQGEERTELLVESVLWDEWEIPRPRGEVRVSEAEGIAPTKARSKRTVVRRAKSLKSGQWA